MSVQKSSVASITTAVRSSLQTLIRYCPTMLSQPTAATAVPTRSETPFRSQASFRRTRTTVLSSRLNATCIGACCRSPATHPRTYIVDAGVVPSNISRPIEASGISKKTLPSILCRVTSSPTAVVCFLPSKSFS